MANEFNKEERVAFEQILEGFEDNLVLSNAVDVYSTDQTMMERTNDTIWRPQPYIMQSFDGLDQTGNFQDATQLSVPANIGFKKSSPWTMNAVELRDALQEGRLGEGAKQKLASDINVAVTNLACSEGTIVVTHATAANSYDQVAEADAVMNELGIDMDGRYLALSSRDYNGLSGNLAARQTMNEMPTKAWKKSYVGEVAGFETLKLGYTNRLAAAAGGGALTIDTQVGAANFYVPKATATGTTGTNNVDNRYQNITVSATTNVAAGDCFTIAGVESVHHITKQSTGQLKTFRVMEVINGTTLKISPAIISNQGSTDAEAQYQNVEVTPSATAAITFLNTTLASANPFWTKGSIEILPGRYAIPANAGAAIMRGATEQGIEIVMTKQFDNKTMVTDFRVDVFFGVTMLQPEMCGIMLFNQT